MKVVIVVKDGVVESVYSDDKDVDLDIIDLDAQDEAEERANDKALEKAQAKLRQVY